MEGIDLPEWAELTLQWLAIVVIAGTALSAFLGSIIPRLRALAERTAWDGDDKAVAWLAKAQGVLAYALEVVQVFLPRIGLGKPPMVQAPRDEHPTGRASLRSTTKLLVFLALLFAGCGGNAEVIARQSIATAGEYRAAVAEANADAMRLSRQADLAGSETRDEWERRRAVYYRVEESGRVLEGFLRAAESALNMSGTDAWPEMAGCVLGALIGLQLALDALEDMGITLPLPDTVAGIDVADLLGTLAPYASHCPYPISLGGA